MLIAAPDCYTSLTWMPPENIESCSSSSVACVPGGTSKAIFTWIVLPGLMSPMMLRSVFIHIPAALLASYSRPLASTTLLVLAEIVLRFIADVNH